MARRTSPCNRPGPLGWRRLVRDVRGGTAIEYGLILALVTLAMMGALIGVADVTTNMWGNINDKVTKAR